MGMRSGTRRTLAVAAVAAVIGLSAGCGDDDGSVNLGNRGFGFGNAIPDSVDPGDLGPQPFDPEDEDVDVDPGDSDGDLIEASGMDPCTTLTPDDLLVLGLPEVPSEVDSGDDGSHCGWAAGNTRVLVAIGDGDFDEVEESLGLGVAEPEDFAGRDAARISGPEACALLFHATDDRTLGVVTSNPDGHCSIVDQAALQVLNNVS